MPYKRSRTPGVLAGGHAETIRAGQLILEAGGNAFDAAAAALLASFVAEPCMSSMGGGFFAAFRSAEGQTGIIDAFCATPQNWRPEPERDFQCVTVDFGTATEDFHVGWASIAVPGAPAGFEALAAKGRLPRAELVAPAIDLARNGCRVDAFQAYDFHLLEAILRRNHPAAAPFFDANDSLLTEGNMLRQLNQAGFLEAFGHHEPGWFYAGEPAAALVAAAEAQGGQISQADMLSYHVVEREALHAQVHGMELWTNPAPSAGGSLMALALSLLEHAGEPGQHGYATAVASALLEAASVREGAAWSPDVREALDNLKGGHVFTEPEAPGPAGGTTHFNVLDAQGNAVALSSSNGEGSGCWLPQTGVQLNNMLGEAALFPRGFHRGPGGVRVGSLMTPCVAYRPKDGFLLAMGSGGAGRIPSVLTQVFYRIAGLGEDPAQAVEAPRLHWQGRELNQEPGLGAPVLAPGCSARTWLERDMFFGGVHIAWQAGAHRHVVADARRFGSTARVD